MSSTNSMELGNYKIRFSEETILTQGWLEANIEAAQRVFEKYKNIYPTCTCNPKEQPRLYIARKNNFYLARMPGTGFLHAMDCDFYGVPDALSGISGYRKGVVTEEEGSGLKIKLGVALGVVRGGKKNTATRVSPPVTEKVEDEDTNRKGKISLRGLLDLLWDQSQYNRWHPRMQGRRNYASLQKHINQAAERILVKERALKDYLYIPEIFFKDQSAAIEKRAQQRLYELSLSTTGQKQSFMVFGIIRHVRKGEFGYGIQVAHAPANIIFWIKKEDLSEKDTKELEKTSAVKESEELLATLLVVERSVKGNFNVKECTWMPLDEHYLPAESKEEKIILATLAEQKRQFSRQMRFDAPHSEVYPNFLLLDAGDHPVPMFIVGTDDRSKVTHDKGVRELIHGYAHNGDAYWCWDRKWSEDELTAFPPRANATALSETRSNSFAPATQSQETPRGQTNTPPTSASNRASMYER